MRTNKSYLTFSVPLDSGGSRNDMAALSKNAFFQRLLTCSTNNVRTARSFSHGTTQKIFPPSRKKLTIENKKEDLLGVRACLKKLCFACRTTNLCVGTSSSSKPYGNIDIASSFSVHAMMTTSL